MEHKFTIGLENSSKEKAKEVAEALVSIRNVLGDEDTIELAKMLKKNPGIVKTAKKYFS